MQILLEARSLTRANIAIKCSRARGISNAMFWSTPARSRINARNVPRPSPSPRTWKSTTAFTLARNLTRVISAAEDLPSLPTYNGISWPTQARNLISASIALKHLWVLAICEGTFVSIPGSVRTNVSSALRPLQRPEICSRTFLPTLEKNLINATSATGNSSARATFALTFASIMHTTWRNPQTLPSKTSTHGLLLTQLLSKLEKTCLSRIS